MFKVFMRKCQSQERRDRFPGRNAGFSSACLTSARRRGGAAVLQQRGTQRARGRVTAREWRAGNAGGQELAGRERKSVVF